MVAPHPHLERTAERCLLDELERSAPHEAHLHEANHHVVIPAHGADRGAVSNLKGVERGWLWRVRHRPGHELGPPRSRSRRRLGCASHILARAANARVCSPAVGALPIDAVLPEVLDAARAGNVVLVAPPGAGKTTRVPSALFEGGLAGDGEILVLEPRRLAARLAAERVASELGEPVGGTCGYQVRFEQAVSDRTRIRFITEGLLTRRLRDDPQLRGVTAVVFDELHERHLATDLGLALVRRLQRERRPELRILAMSATLAAEPVASFLDAPTLRSEGRAFPVEVEHLGPSDRPLERQVLRALAQLLDDARAAGHDGIDGHVLVFLPGAREIRRCAEACEPLARSAGIRVLPLHGELPRREQDQAVGPSPTPKLILATNVAETSITIDGVVAVIDSGLARVAIHDPWSGMPRLGVGPISRASAEQRAGRAGRTRAGRCLRLYGQHDLAHRRAHDRPEIERLDLASALLDLHAAGVTEAASFPWFEAPPTPAVEAACGLLTQLGAIGDEGLTPLGRAMLPLPVHPRLARFLVAAREQGLLRDAAWVAAVLGERSAFRDRGPALHEGDADVLEEVARLRRKDPSADRTQASRIARVATQLESALGKARPRPPGAAEERDARLREALLLAYPDRLARLREDGHDRRSAVFASGGSAEVAPSSVVRSAELVVVLAVQEQRRADGRAGRGKLVARSLAAIEPDWVLEHFLDELVEDQQVRFDDKRQRVVGETRLRLGELVLESTATDRPTGPSAEACLREAARATGPGAFADAQTLTQLARRSRFVANHVEGFPVIDDAKIAAVLDRLCEGRSSFAQLREADLLAHVRAELGSHVRELDRWAPAQIALPGGRKLQITYETDRAPWVASRLQDFFGMADGPRVAGGRVPLVLHLRAPNNRDVQVTTDLAGFWDRHYGDLSRSLKRRYPRHDWPDDPRTATPPAPGGRGRQRRK